MINIFERKLKIIADFKAGKQVVIRNVEADYRCYNEVLIEIKKLRIQPNLDFLQEGG
jgi:hypothetical protein